MPETPTINPPPEDPEKPRQSMTMMDFAKREDRVFLADYINYTKELYGSQGITVDKFRFFPETDTEQSKVEIEYIPTRLQEGHEGVSHGGISMFMIDSSSGAFAMCEGTPDEIAVTEKHVSITFPGLVRTGMPTQVVSRRATEEEVKEEGIELKKRQILIHTDAIQDGEVLVSGKTVCAVVPKSILDRVREMKR